MMGAHDGCSYVGITIMPPLFGLLAQGIGMNLFPYYLAALFVIMILSMVSLCSVNLKSHNPVDFQFILHSYTGTI